MSSPLSTLEALLTPSPAVFILGTLIVLLVPILLHYILTRATPYTSLPTILLLGPPGVGKTALLTLFERGPLSTTSAATPTHTSQVPLSITLAVAADGRPPATTSFRDNLDANGTPAHKFLLIDTPGHAKLRGRYALSRLGGASGGKQSISTSSRLKGVVFMVDAAALAEPGSSSATAGLAASAEYLYDVLVALQRRQDSGKSSRAAGAVPVLVAGNKADLFTAYPAGLVRSQLEDELSRIRRARRKGLLDSTVAADEIGAAGKADESENWLGEWGTDKFEFRQMREYDVEVTVVSGNVVGEGPGVEEWWRWMADNI